MAHLLIRCASLAVERLSPAVFAKDPSRGGEWPPQRRVRVQDVSRMSVTMSTSCSHRRIGAGALTTVRRSS